MFIPIPFYIRIPPDSGCGTLGAGLLLALLIGGLASLILPGLGWIVAAFIGVLVAAGIHRNRG